VRPLAVQSGYIVAFPPDSMPCAACQSTARELRFRGWARIIGMIVLTREGRVAAYVCSGCAEKQTTKTLFFNAVLGWWSIPSFLFYGWRALVINFRSLWAPPENLGKWGAVSVAEFLDFMQRGWEQAVDEMIIRDSPLRFLSKSQIDLVLAAERLYETLGVPQSASHNELRTAYHTRCKEAHPDIQSGSTQDMIRLNLAWEILRSEKMRDAYDWLQQQQGAV
jgi:DnaJ domain